MPIIKSAIKKLRKDRKREIHNTAFKDNVKKAIKKAKQTKKDADIRKAISMVNKGAKKHIYHKNKSARLTSSLAKIAAKKSESLKIKPKVEKKPIKS